MMSGTDLAPRDPGALMLRLRELSSKMKTAAESAARFTSLIKESEVAMKAALNNSKNASAELSVLRESARRQRGSMSEGDAEEAAQQLRACEESRLSVQSIAPSTGSLFVRLFLGQVNVRVASEEDKQVLRSEYEKFRFRTNFGFLIFPAMWIATQMYLRFRWQYTHWVYILTHVWLLYYYVSLALRINILKNDSAIKPWWIYHHYVSALMSIIALTWPSDLQEAPIWERYYLHFSLYFMYHGCFQFVQSRFQAARFYVRISMADAKPMDLSSTETITEFKSSLWVVVAMGVLGHVMQVWLGVTLIRMLLEQLSSQQSRPWFAFKEEIQCALLGALFLILGVVNFATTVQTLLGKWAKEAAGRKATAKRQGRSGDGGGGNSSSGGGGGAAAARVATADGAPGITPLPTADGSAELPAQARGGGKPAEPAGAPPSGGGGNSSSSGGGGDGGGGGGGGELLHATLGGSSGGGGAGAAVLLSRPSEGKLQAGKGGGSSSGGGDGELRLRHVSRNV